MSLSPYIGSLELVAFAFVPRNWAACNGQLLPIAQNQALFSLLGTFYGGNGTTNFALPDLRSRVPIHQGQGPATDFYPLGAQGGRESVTLLAPQLPTHDHTLIASGRQATTASPAGALMAAAAVPRYATAAGADAALSPASFAVAGGGQPHENRAPSLTLNWIIALNGIYPARN